MYKLLLPLSLCFLCACSGAQTQSGSLYPPAEINNETQADAKAELAVYKKQISKNINDASAYFKAAQLSLSLGNLNQADLYIKHALKINDEKADHHFVQAQIDAAAGRFVNAAGELQNYFSLPRQGSVISQTQTQELCRVLYRQNFTLESCGYKPNPNNILETFLPALSQTADYYTPKPLNTGAQ